MFFTNTYSQAVPSPGNFPKSLKQTFGLKEFKTEFLRAVINHKLITIYKSNAMAEKMIVGYLHTTKLITYPSL